MSEKLARDIETEDEVVVPIEELTRRRKVVSEYQTLTRPQKIRKVVTQLFISQTTWTSEQKQLWTLVCDEEIAQRAEEEVSGSQKTKSLREELEDMFPPTFTE